MGNRIIENSQNSGVRLFSIESSVAIIIHTNKRVYNMQAHMHNHVYTGT